MNRVRLFIMLLIGFFCLCFLSDENVVSAKDVIIEEYPIVTEIVYGEPLFQATFIGGKANVDGKFVWVEEDAILDAGISGQRVIFFPTDTAYSYKELVMDVKVNKRKVELKFEDELYKQYDQKSTIDLPNYVVVGIIDKSVYVRGELKASLESGLVGENVKVILSGLELVGEGSSNYSLVLTGHSATIHPDSIEKFGPVKNKIDFDDKTFVPVGSNLFVEQVENLEMNNYIVRETYDVYVKSDNKRFDISGKVDVKIKIDENSLKGKRIKLFNYYNGKYENIEYEYIDGYLIYTSNGLGNLVIAQKEKSYWWAYFILIVFVLSVLVVVIRNIIVNKPKIYKYKSLKRSKDDGDY